MRTEFSVAGYQELLEGFQRLGYSATSFEDARPEARHLVLRHDVDMALQGASELAQIERRFGFRATYFVLVRTEMYNPFSPRSEREMRTILEAGHEVGLHFDASVYAGDFEALDRACRMECELLETFCGKPVQLVSYHRPAAALLGRPGRVGGRRHTYEPCYFQDLGYCSDSRGGWHHGHPFEHDAIAAGRALQLLTHPIWWVGDQALEPLAKLGSFLEERCRLLSDELARNCEPWAQARKSSRGLPGG